MRTIVESVLGPGEAQLYSGANFRFHLHVDSESDNGERVLIEVYNPDLPHDEIMADEHDRVLGQYVDLDDLEAFVRHARGTLIDYGL